MPYPVLPPDPPPVVNMTASEGDAITRVSSSELGSSSTTAVAEPFAAVISSVQPSVIAPEIVQERREAVPLDAVVIPVQRSEVLGTPLEATASVQQAMEQAQNSVSPQPVFVGVAPSRFLAQLPSPRSSVSVPSMSGEQSGIPELEQADPQAFDPATLDLTPLPAIASLPPQQDDAEVGRSPSADELATVQSDLFDPLGEGADRALTTILVPLFAGLENHVQEIQATAETGDRVSQLSDTDPSLPPQDLPSPFPTQPPVPTESTTPVEPPEEIDPLDSDVPPESPPEQPTLEIPTPDNPLPESEPLETPEAAPDAEPNPTGVGETVEVFADRQEYDQIRQVFIAEGNVEVRFRDSILRADRVIVNLPNRTTLAEGNAVLLANQQILYGDRMQYDFVRQEGSIDQARGEIALSSLPEDSTPRLSPHRTNLPEDLLRLRTPEDQPPGDILLQRQPPQATPSGQTLDFGVGVGEAAVQLPTGQVRRLRFEADTIDFFPGGWEATNLRLTNDPFSPPELEIRSRSARFSRVSPTQQVLVAQNPRLVFDQGLNLPLIRERYVFSDEERRRNPFFVSFGFDEEDRGGFFIERTFQIVNQPGMAIQLTPQFYVQRAIDSDDFFAPSSFGLEGEARIQVTPTTTLFGKFELYSFELSEFEDNFSSNVRLAQRISDHTLSIFHTYRERIFNGSLGNQTVQNSYGAVVTSPTYTLGNTGIEFSYQAGIQSITANINRDFRDEILGPPPRDNNRGTLTRYQIAAELGRSFLIWEGEPLPATPSEGLRYTPTPVIPFLSFDANVLGVASFYSSGDTQPILQTTVGLSGQFGHFSKPAFDYLGFNISFSFIPDGPESPFNFDREDDRQVLSGGLTAQLFGPIRAGFQTSYNLEKDEEINTTIFIQYTRRTYSIDLRYSPIRELGSLNFVINDFNWTGETTPFDESDYHSTSSYPDR